MDPDELDPLDDALPAEDDDTELSAATDDDDALPPEGGEDDGALDAEQQPVRRPSRGENRYQRLSNENRELRTRLDAIERERRQPQGPTAADRERAEREERERLQFMSPEEQARYFYEKGQREFGQRMGALQAQMQDQADSARFEALCARNPTAARYHDEVERQLAVERSNGNFFIGREGVLRLMLGERALKGQRTAATRQRREGAQAVRRETVNPPRQPRQGAQPQNVRLSEREERRKRLENVTF